MTQYRHSATADVPADELFAFLSHPENPAAVLPGNEGRRADGEEGLTWHNPNSLILVEGPEIKVQPVGIRRLPAGDQAPWR
jgi:hypothetical protein